MSKCEDCDYYTRKSAALYVCEEEKGYEGADKEVHPLMKACGGFRPKGVDIEIFKSERLY